MRPQTTIELDNIPAGARGCVLAVGNFDGVHLGHRRILQVGAELARSAAGKLVVLTFDPPPAEVLAPDRAPHQILPAGARFDLLSQAGADLVVVARPTAEFLSAEPERFVRETVVGRLRPSAVVEGPNFRFGRGRAGGVDTLRRLAGEGGFEVVEVEPVMIDLSGRQVRVSSSLVRELLEAGAVEDAARCLGRDYVLHGQVVGGERRGRGLEFPTANVAPAGVMCPADGVYAARAAVGGGSHAAAVSIGTKPTFGKSPRAVEVHLLDACGDFYGCDISVAFLARLREQRRFADADRLRAQIREDIKRVRELCG